MILSPCRRQRVTTALVLLALVALVVVAAPAFAQSSAPAPAPAHQGGGEANLKIPPLDQVQFLGMNGRTLLMLGLVVCVLGLVFGLVDLHAAQEPAGAPVDARDLRADLRDLQDLPDHAGQVHPDPRGLHRRDHRRLLRRRSAHLRRRRRSSSSCSSASSASRGSYGVAWFGIRINTFANSRTAFAASAGKPFPAYAIPLKAGMSIGMLLISRRAAPDARASCSSSPATTPARASSASPSASRSAPRRCASPAASSRRSPTSAPT